MSKKAVFLTFVAAAAVVVAVGLLSFWMARNQPSADISRVPSLPPIPGTTPAAVAPAQTPPTPPTPRLKGDANNDGIVDVRDINVLISHWGQVKPKYNLIDDPKGEAGVINVLDLAQVIKYWKCVEGKEGCGYMEDGNGETRPPAEQTTEITVALYQITNVPGAPLTVRYLGKHPGREIYIVQILPNSPEAKCVSRQYAYLYPSTPLKIGCLGNATTYSFELVAGKSDGQKVTLKITASSSSSLSPTPTPTLSPSPSGRTAKVTANMGQSAVVPGMPYRIYYTGKSPGRESYQASIMPEPLANTCTAYKYAWFPSTSPVRTKCQNTIYTFELVANESNQQKITLQVTASP